MAKKIVSLIICFVVLVAALPVQPATAGDYTVRKSLRITVDGKVYETSAYLDNKKEIYITAGAAQKLLGKKAPVDKKIGGKAYTKLSSYAKKCGAASYTYDETLNASYIWMSDPYSAEERAMYYGLGKTSSKQITYKQLFKILDKAAVRTGSKKEKTWKSKFKKARTSTKKMTRVEGMMAFLHLAVTLGGEYAEFNADWGGIHEEIGETVWNEIKKANKKKKLFTYFKDKNPNQLGGFKNDSYVHEWNTLGAAYIYSFGRASVLTGETLFDYDAAKKTMHPVDALTCTDALRAAARFVDSAKKEKAHFTALNDKNAVTYDKSTLTPKIIRQSGTMTPVSTDVSDWKGFVIYQDYSDTQLDVQNIIKYLKHLSEWGFHTARLMLTYQTFFDQRATQVDTVKLQQLDQIIAATVQYRIHLNLVTISIPGRWPAFDGKDFTSTGEFDLFLNPQRQAEAQAVWELIAHRYQDVSAHAISFCPIWETMNFDLSTGVEAQYYTPEQVADVYEKITSGIQKYNKERLVIYEATAANPAESICKEAAPVKKVLESHHKNVQIISNFCEMPYVYAEMTATQGEHIDNNNHSMFKPAYPVQIYAACDTITEKGILLDGDLPSGTKLSLHLSKVDGDGTLTITGDGKTLYTEKLSFGQYKTGSLLSGYYPYAKSEKCITLALPETISNLQITYDGGGLTWSGMDVTLPKEYEQMRWWNQSFYDLYLEGKEQTAEAVMPAKKPTSNIMVCPNSSESGTHLTIYADRLTYTSETLSEQANKQTVDAWGKQISQFAPHSLVRIENPAFCIGTDLDSALAYYEDVFAMCKENSLGWLSNDLDVIFGQTADIIHMKYGGAKATSYDNGYLQKDLLQLHQKYAVHTKHI